ncbi:hypothetical protein FA95DRAFT_1564122 [Auriscalpium vulgare]|uniref:Uncharacterized protein n=1 Tax=Auriscalpium vulgare TaxID=40419 RepID=A0ACB8REK8_9AGAM|nr:hypothetical protein FA95DRAFT_1564122 [Auriscalpium vulgare]
MSMQGPDMASPQYFPETTAAYQFPEGTGTFVPGLQYPPGPYAGQATSYPGYDPHSRARCC